MQIDREELGMALTDHSGVQWYLNRETGEVIPDVEGDVDGESEQFVPIAPLPSFVAYDLRVEFTEDVDDPVLKARLQEALRGKGAFRRFLDIVRETQETESRWFAREAAWMDRQVSEWLKDNGPSTSQNAFRLF
jgi:hypothetical protein